LWRPFYSPITLAQQSAQNAPILLEGAPIARCSRHDQQTAMAKRVDETNFRMPTHCLDLADNVVLGENGEGIADQGS
jgi:hypothetical protein